MLFYFNLSPIFKIIHFLFIKTKVFVIKNFSYILNFNTFSVAPSIISDAVKKLLLNAVKFEKNGHKSANNERRKITSTDLEPVLYLSLKVTTLLRGLEGSPLKR